VGEREGGGTQGGRGENWGADGGGGMVAIGEGGRKERQRRREK